jgi:hypothetical protein
MNNKILVASKTNGSPLVKQTSYLWPILLSPTNRLIGLEATSETLLAVFQEDLDWPAIDSDRKYIHHWLDVTPIESVFNLNPKNRLPIECKFAGMDWSVVRHERTIKDLAVVSAQEVNAQIDFLLADRAAIMGFIEMTPKENAITLMSWHSRLEAINQELLELGYETKTI